MVRPGRLDKLLYVDLPTPDERVEILRAQTKKTPLASEVDLEIIARDIRCEGFSGADLSALVREAAVAALREVFINVELGDEDYDQDETVVNHDDVDDDEEEMKKPNKVEVGMSHFLMALGKVAPSVSASQRKRFALLRAKFAGQPIGRSKEGREEVVVGTERIQEVTLT
jgi:ribosome biogenesis ATPase